MSDNEDVFKAIEEQGTRAPQFRIYLLSEGRPPIAGLSGALPDYEIVLPRSKNEIAFIRKMAIESREEFRRECERVAAIMAPLLVPDSCLGCVYDDARGKTRFQMELRKTDESPRFVETDPGSDLG